MAEQANTPKILLVSLVHNRKNLVSEAFLSAANQTLPKKYWDYLIWDNASTDGAKKIATAFTNKYKNFNLIGYSVNLGQQKAYNVILKNWLQKHPADVMAILDSDDTLTPNALSEVYNMYLQHPEIGGTYSGFCLMRSNGKPIVKNHPKARYFPDQFTEEGQKKLRRIFLKENPCGHLRTYSVQALKAIGGFNERYQFATDYNVFGRLMGAGYKVVKINKVLYNFRQHGDQIQGKFSPQQTKDWMKMQKEFKILFKKQGLI